MTRSERLKRGLLRVGELAERAGVLSSTIRHYTNVGLLYPASTTPGGHRLYEEKESLARLREIKRINSQRPSLAQIRERIDRQFNSGEKMKKVWVNKTDSFQKAEEFDDQYNLSLSSEERLSAVQFLREEYFKINRGLRSENRKGLRRVLRIVKQK